MYRAVWTASAGCRVLDVGCATGRLVLDYAAQGIDIDGVDNSPEILAICQEKAKAAGVSPTLYCQTMESMELPRTYKTLLVPSSSFQLLTDAATATQGIQRLFMHVAPGGVLVMPFMTLWQEGEQLETDWAQTGDKIRPSDGVRIRRWSRTRFDPASNCEDTQYRYEVEYDGKVIASEEHCRSPATRSYTQEQAMNIYQEAGFATVEIYSGFTWKPVKPSDRLFTVIGKRAV